jgi:hypothetical protein
VHNRQAEVEAHGAVTEERRDHVAHTGKREATIETARGTDVGTVEKPHLKHIVRAGDWRGETMDARRKSEAKLVHFFSKCCG